MPDAVRVIDRASEIVVSPVVKTKDDVQEALEALELAITESSGAPYTAPYVLTQSTGGLPNQVNLGGLSYSGILAVSISGGLATLSTTTDYATYDDPRFKQMTANNQTDNYTLVLTDAGKVIEMNKGSAVNLTIPANATVAFPVGTVIEVWQQGAGQVTVVAAGGVTLRSNGDKVKTAAQYATIALRKQAVNTWVISGDLA